VRLDERGGVIGITIVNAKWLQERDSGLKVTAPSLMETAPRDLAKALDAAGDGPPALDAEPMQHQH
jgi:hypothetical protein